MKPGNFAPRVKVYTSNHNVTNPMRDVATALGNRYGCHTCGTRVTGVKTTGRFRTTSSRCRRNREAVATEYCRTAPDAAPTKASTCCEIGHCSTRTGPSVGDSSLIADLDTLKSMTLVAQFTLHLDFGLLIVGDPDSQEVGAPDEPSSAIAAGDSRIVVSALNRSEGPVDIALHDSESTISGRPSFVGTVQLATQTVEISDATRSFFFGMELNDSLVDVGIWLSSPNSPEKVTIQMAL